MAAASWRSARDAAAGHLLGDHSQVARLGSSGPRLDAEILGSGSFRIVAELLRGALHDDAPTNVCRLVERIDLKGHPDAKTGSGELQSRCGSDDDLPSSRT